MSRRVVLAVLAGTLLSLSLAGAARASRSFSVAGGGRAITARSQGGGITFAEEGERKIITDVTLSGSLHLLVSKVRGALAGVITFPLFSNCRTSGAFGSECFSRGLAPFHLALESFTGTLPRIQTITLAVDSAFYIIIGASPWCLYRGRFPLTGGRNSGETVVIESMRVGRNSLALHEAQGEELFRRCAPTGEFVGSFAMLPTITLRLH